MEPENVFSYQMNRKICIKLGIIGNGLIEYSFNISQKPIVVGR